MIYRYVWYRNEPIVKELISKNPGLPRSVYFGYGQLYSAALEEQVTDQQEPGLLRLGHLSSADVLNGLLHIDDTQWYVFAVKRIDNNVYIDEVDEFLPPSVGQGQYEKYD